MVVGVAGFDVGAPVRPAVTCWVGDVFVGAGAAGVTVGTLVSITAVGRSVLTLGAFCAALVTSDGISVLSPGVPPQRLKNVLICCWMF